VKQADPAPEVYRLGRRLDPWAWPDWAYAEADGTFGTGMTIRKASTESSTHRPSASPRSSSASPPYRADVQLVAELQAIAGNEGDEEPPAPGTVPADWVDSAVCDERRS
jgi:hypothetical protein